MNGEIKIVIAHKDDRGSIGVQSPDCDPIFRTFEGNLGTVVERVSGVVEEARQLWEENPQFPKCESPLPSQAQPVPTTRAATRPARTSNQQPMF